MSGDWRKLTIGLSAEQDIERLRARALALAEWVRIEQNHGPPNYHVEVVNFGERSARYRGGRERCIGYAIAKENDDSGGAWRVVAPSGYIVWPEDGPGWVDDSL